MHVCICICVHVRNVLYCNAMQCNAMQCNVCVYVCMCVCVYVCMCNCATRVCSVMQCNALQATVMSCHVMSCFVCRCAGGACVCISVSQHRTPKAVLRLVERIKQHFGRLARRPRLCGAFQGAAKYSILWPFYKGALQGTLKESVA